MDVVEDHFCQTNRDFHKIEKIVHQAATFCSISVDPSHKRTCQSQFSMFETGKKLTVALIGDIQGIFVKQVGNSISFNVNYIKQSPKHGGFYVL